MSEKTAQVMSFGLSGVSGFPVTVEVFAVYGMPKMDIIGLPDASVRESQDRVKAAILNSAVDLRDEYRLTVSLAPADIRKEGPSFDLPIATGILLSENLIQPAPGIDMDHTVLFGELSLDGHVRPVNGALSMVISARENGYQDVILPADNAREVACIDGMRVYPVTHLREVIDHLEGRTPIPPQAQMSYDDLLNQKTFTRNLSEVKGQQGARRALEVAAAGGHNMLMVGSPGSGKTMLARCLPGILPPLSFAESLETTRIHSIAGRLRPGDGLMVERPFCAPHHSASVASMVGGGSKARPGEISLAHNGVLFLDELPEFSRNVLEALRQPLEDGTVSITRVQHKAQYQASFMLIAGMNPCPCGYYGSRQRECRCTASEIRRYLDQISGPLLDRIDLQVEVNAVPVSEINTSAPAESSETVAERVLAARRIQQERYRETPIHTNARLDSAGIKEFCPMTGDAETLLHMAVDRLHMSMRAYGRIIKVARTIADLKAEQVISGEDIAEAIQYRELDQKYWR